MDRSEELAKVYPYSLGLGPAVYEPDGQVPPDFMIGDIGIEVRRLNQNFESDDGYEGLESVEASVLRYVEKLLPTNGPPKDGQGWWVSLTFWRPPGPKGGQARAPQGPRGLLRASQPGGPRHQAHAEFRAGDQACWHSGRQPLHAGRLF